MSIRFENRNAASRANGRKCLRYHKFGRNGIQRTKRTACPHEVHRFGLVDALERKLEQDQFDQKRKNALAKACRRNDYDRIARMLRGGVAVLQEHIDIARVQDNITLEQRLIDAGVHQHDRSNNGHPHLSSAPEVECEGWFGRCWNVQNKFVLNEDERSCAVTGEGLNPNGVFTITGSKTPYGYNLVFFNMFGGQPVKLTWGDGGQSLVGIVELENSKGYVVGRLKVRFTKRVIKMPQKETISVSLAIRRDDEGLYVYFADLTGDEVCQPYQFRIGSKVKDLLDYLLYGRSFNCSSIVFYNGAERVSEQDDIASYEVLTAALAPATNSSTAQSPQDVAVRASWGFCPLGSRSG